MPLMAYHDADKRPLAWLRTFIYYNQLGFEVVCGGQYMRAKHKATGCIVGGSTPKDGLWHVPHLLANSLNANYRRRESAFVEGSARQAIYRKRRRK